jgi:taurine dioxygenase
MYLAYEKLSDRMKAYLEGLRGFHATDASFVAYIRDHLPEESCEKVMDAVGTGTSHPIVRTHPETGRKALFVDRSFMTHIEDLGKEESRSVHDFLSSRANDISIQCRFRWTKGAVAVWDERATQHAGVADHVGSSRVADRTYRPRFSSTSEYGC